jgi:hypothetical protein
MEVAENLVIVKDHELECSIVKIRNKENPPKDVLAHLVAFDVLTG